MPIDFQNLLTRKTLERFKWVLFISVPVWFGYGFARDPANLEWVKQAFPSAASDRQGHGGRDLPTLEDEVNRYALEQRIEKALEELKRRKAAKEAN
eukprot:gene12776-12904_t